MLKNQKIIVGIVAAVVILGGVALYFIFRDTARVDQAGETGAQPGWKSYQSKQNGFTIQYPATFNDADIQDAQNVFRIYFPPSTTTTNLANAMVYVETMDNDCSGWRSLKSNTKTDVLPAELTVDGKVLTLRSVKEQPPGHEGYNYLYFTQANNQCYTVAILLLSRAMDTYTPATRPEPYRSEEFEKTFLEIVRTFKVSNL